MTMTQAEYDKQDEQLLGKMLKDAEALVKCLKLELSGVRDGDGYWHGTDPIGHLITNLWEHLEVSLNNMVELSKSQLREEVADYAGYIMACSLDGVGPEDPRVQETVRQVMTDDSVYHFYLPQYASYREMHKDDNQVDFDSLFNSTENGNDMEN